MKIQPVMEAIRSLETVREKKDEQKRQQQGKQQEKDKKKDNPVFEVNEEKVTHAMAAFQTDSQAVAAGLSVAKEGVGPGLRVVLKDGNGAVIRQFTGEEFLQMREAAGHNGRSSGKILDRKY